MRKRSTRIGVRGFWETKKVPAMSSQSLPCPARWFENKRISNFFVFFCGNPLCFVFYWTHIDNEKSVANSSNKLVFSRWFVFFFQQLLFVVDIKKNNISNAIFENNFILFTWNVDCGTAKLFSEHYLIVLNL